MSPFTFAANHTADLVPAPARADVPVTRPTYAEPVTPMRRRPDPRDASVHAALDVPRLTITRMADVLGVPRATLEAYRLGTRRMPPAVRARLAEFLARHAETMREVSAALLADDTPTDR
ncbi:hypothetical protein tb265_17330 [Gemmatimonadetes bacterium T265]|nr:hypothetical protein tb265_17330 [Gemmatimonadetes bacterium T265]